MQLIEVNFVCIGTSTTKRIPYIYLGSHYDMYKDRKFKLWEMADTYVVEGDVRDASRDC